MPYFTCAFEHPESVDWRKHREMKLKWPPAHGSVDYVGREVMADCSAFLGEDLCIVVPEVELS